MFLSFFCIFQVFQLYRRGRWAHSFINVRQLYAMRRAYNDKALQRHHVIKVKDIKDAYRAAVNDKLTPNTK